MFHRIPLRLGAMLVTSAFGLVPAAAVSPSTSAQSAGPHLQSANVPMPSELQLRNYAASLIAIEPIQTALTSQSDALSPDKRQALEDEARRRIGQILARNELDIAAFNAISTRIEHSPVLQRRVRQLVMEQKIGF